MRQVLAMTSCPKCHYTRRAIDDQVNPAICPACGIVYDKWIAKQQEAAQDTGAEQTTTLDGTQEKTPTFTEWILYVPDRIDIEHFGARVLCLLLFAFWGIHFIRAGVDWEIIGSSFLHNVNLPFHEFGHIFFRPFGLFMTILGGSLFQVLMPLSLMGVFMWKQRDNFAASIMLWWCGQNFIDVSPYIDDANYRMLPLVGGGGEESHDWGNLLTMLNALEKTHTISHTSFWIGAIIMVAALLWSAALLIKQKQHIKQRAN